MWVTIIACVLVVAMLVGPVMLLQPTTQQKRLAKLRSIANNSDLHVRITQNPASGDPRQIAVYSFRVPRDIGEPNIKPWCLSRQNFEHELNFVADWDWKDAARPPKEKRDAIRSWLMDLPAPIRAVEVSDVAVEVYWTEVCWHRSDKWEDAAHHCVAIIDKKLHDLAQLIV